MNQLVTLSDGSSVNLNDGSSIKFNSGIFTNTRKIHLVGEGLFKVTKGEKFTVFSKNGKVEVLGTEFNVRAWGDKLKVECYEGIVRVTKLSQSFTLTQGESVILERGKGSIKVPISNNQPDWANGISTYQDESISEVFNEISRQFDIKIDLKNTNQKFTGQFTHDDLNAALESVCLPLGLEFDVNQEKKITTVK